MSVSRSGRTSGRTAAGEHVCVFWLGEQRYAVDAVLVREVVSVSALLPVPATPSWLIGLTNLRGTALAVLDLAEVLDVSKARRTETPGVPRAATVLVLHTGTTLAGVGIDRIEAVYPLEIARFDVSEAVAEHPGVKGILSFELRGGFAATQLDEGYLAERIHGLRFRKTEAGAVLPV